MSSENYYRRPRITTPILMCSTRWKVMCLCTLTQTDLADNTLRASEFLKAHLLQRYLSVRTLNKNSRKNCSSFNFIIPVTSEVDDHMGRTPRRIYFRSLKLSEVGLVAAFEKTAVIKSARMYRRQLLPKPGRRWRHSCQKTCIQERTSFYSKHTTW